MEIDYVDGAKFEIKTRGHTVISDQPKPFGENRGMTPPELLAGALGSCIGVFAAEYLKRNELPVEGLKVELDWQRADKPKRIGSYVANVSVPHRLTPRQQASLSRIVKACTVHNTLSHPPKIDVELIGPDH